jgi:hypothetical protein
MMWKRQKGKPIIMETTVQNLTPADGESGPNIEARIGSFALNSVSERYIPEYVHHVVLGGDAEVTEARTSLHIIDISPTRTIRSISGVPTWSVWTVNTAFTCSGNSVTVTVPVHYCLDVEGKSCTSGMMLVPRTV